MVSIRPIRALTRGLDALALLNVNDGATVSEIARELRLPRTTIYRILETLCESGFVFRDVADERYRLTLQVRQLSAGFADEAWVTRIAKPLLFELAESIVWPVYMATPDGSSLIVRETTDHVSPLAIERYSAGMQLPLLSTSAGRVYLAFCADERRSLLLEKLGREDAQARDHGEVHRLLGEIRAQGYATAVYTRQVVEELSISVPLTLHDRAPGVLTVRFAGSAVPIKTGLERFLPKLRQCAAKIAVTFLQASAAGEL